MTEGLKMKYFVLKPEYSEIDDPYAVASCYAMLIYADYIEAENPVMAKELTAWANSEIQKNENWAKRSEKCL